MTFEVRRMSRRHSSGTKDYHLVAITNSEDPRCLFIQRWAKAGQWGQGPKITRCENNPELDRAWADIAKKKFRPGEYDEGLSGQGRKTYKTVEELKTALGTYWHALGEHAEWMIPGCGMADKKPAESKEWDEKEGRWSTDEKRSRERIAKRELEERIAAEQKQLQELESKERAEENPQWGSW